MRTEIILITPQLATTWLDQNHVNRPLRKRHIEYLANEMKLGRWQLTHQGIAFDESGVLIDGQHRLEAIKQVGLPIKMLVTYDVPPNRFGMIDRGISRSLSDITGLPSKAVQIYNFLVASLISQSRKIMPDDIMPLHSKIGNLVMDFLVVARTDAQLYSCTAMKAAAIITVLQGGDKDYVFSIYKNLISLNWMKLPPVALALVKFNERERPVAANPAESKKIFTRGLFVFDVGNKNKTRVYIPQRTNQILMDKAIKTIQKLCANNNKANVDAEKVLLKERLANQAKEVQRALQIAVHNQQEAARSR